MQRVAAASTHLRIHGAWRWLRLASLPIILVVVLWQREWVFSQLETWFGLGFAELPIKLYTTIVERALVAVGCATGFAVLVVSVYATAPPKWRYACAVLLTAAASVALGIILALPLWASFLAALLLALNAIPSATLRRLFDGRVVGTIANVVLGAGLGIAETLLPRPFRTWLVGDRTRQFDKPDTVTTALASWAPGILVAAAVFGLGAAYSKLVKVGWILNASDEVQLVYGGENVGLYSEFDVASIPFDPRDRRLYMCGNGLSEAMVLPADTPAQRAGQHAHGRGSRGVLHPRSH